MAFRAKPIGYDDKSREQVRGRLEGTVAAVERATGVAAAPGASGDAPALPSDLVLIPADNVTALHARSAGAATRVVGLTWRDEYQAVLALPDAGIAEPAQLAGRRLALPRRVAGSAVPGGIRHAGPHAPRPAPSAGHRASSRTVAPDVRRASARRGFDAATGLACLFSDEFTYVDVAVAPGDGAGSAATSAQAYAAEAAALLRGEVDAIFVAGEAGRALARRLAAVEVADLGAHLDPAVRVNATTPLVLAVEERVLDARTDEVGQALRAAPQRCDLAPASVAALRAQKDFLLLQGFIAADVDVAAWIEPGPLAAARATGTAPSGAL